MRVRYSWIIKVWDFFIIMTIMVNLSNREKCVSNVRSATSELLKYEISS
jgi:hypothetical protein